VSFTKAKLPGRNLSKWFKKTHKTKIHYLRFS